MRLHRFIIACALMALIAMAGSALAEEPAVEAAKGAADQVSAAESTEQLTPEELAAKKKEEEQLKMHSDFSRFSDSWIARLNRSHSNGFNNMNIIEDGGVFRARYHRIEKRSSVVRESPSQPGHYCGILRYQDTVYEAVGKSREECTGGEFVPVSGTGRAFSEIFQFKNGAWK
jgi:hypothetical protein